MVNINSVEGIESLIEKRTRPLKGQIRELQTELTEQEQALTIPVVVDCKHDNEIMRQGDGFVYSTCGDCGDEL